MRLARAALPLALAAAALCACKQAGIGPRPVVTQQVFSLPPEALKKIAVLPFYPDPQLGSTISPEKQLGAADTADLIAGFVADALTAKGFEVVPPNDVLAAFVAKGQPLPRLDPRAAAPFAAEYFGASAVMLGKVYRYREREGEALGSLRPASVGYEVTLFAPPAGRRLWSARFDETQQPLTADVFNAQRYPGGGRRWLTAAELARWGADGTAQALLAFR